MTCAYSFLIYYHEFLGPGTTLTSINLAYYFSSRNSIGLKSRKAIRSFPCSVIIHIYMILLDAFFTPSYLLRV